MEEESSDSSFIDDCPNSSEASYDGDTSNSSTDYNVSIEEEIRRTALHKELDGTTARDGKNITNFYPTRFVINYFCSFISRQTMLVQIYEKERWVVPSRLLDRMFLLVL